MNQPPLDLALCIPTLNERTSIEDLLARLHAVLHNGRYTICFVDDGSTDGTREVICRAMIDDPSIHLIEGKRRGPGCHRGLASRRGLEWLMAHTDHPIIVDLDADGSQRPEELVLGSQLLLETGSDVVVASKYAPGAQVVGRPLIRRIASRSYNLFLALTLHSGIRDYSNSYRFYNRRAATLALDIPIRYEGPIHLLEMMATWLANDLTVVEFPTTYDRRGSGNSKVSAIDFVKGGLGALDVVARYWMGRATRKRHPGTIGR
jgi:dolichol-phosphate mannosyltransferase